ncbi:helix-hairpin-helix domain-containing protein [Endozoicomonas sp. SM1973]|uniref:Helix-hairpin-helix domain-containing protein n=1 Tax=Spartinivicinus marinus TaxID=2994442 RepID=A0A853I897_9GAMM|nr:helix-hairpin-helix domain-containing protein [Spartinivicinus marinus]MCX4027167.1 helix-hairpin-helix domain-containing protein [Spartinivicinus marinus]NYZ66111.1 helix-hairpin-helix domain-containing protein [Spartinivicinus marinus]
MFKKLLYFFRKTSSHTTKNISVNTVAKINTTNVDSLDNSVEKIIEEIEQTFTDWQHTGLSSIHPTEVEQCEALIEKLSELEQEQALESNKSECLTAQLNNIKTTMQVFSNKDNTAPDNIEQAEIKQPNQDKAIDETVNAVAEAESIEEQTFTETEKQPVDTDNTQQQPETASPFETADTIEKAYPVGIATNRSTVTTPAVTEPLVNNSVTDESTVDEQEIDEVTDNTAEEVFETTIHSSMTATASNISEQAPEVAEKAANSTQQDSENGSGVDTLIYLPKLSLKTPLACLKQAQIAEKSSEYKKLPKRTKNMLDKHGEWVNPSAELPYQTDIAVEDKPAYLAFLQQLLDTLENKQLTSEQKVAELTKVEEQESWQPFVTSHFGNDEDWKIAKSIEQEVKSIKGISTKLAVLLFKQGYTSKQAICNAPDDVLLALPRVGKATLEKIRNSNK